MKLLLLLFFTFLLSSLRMKMGKYSQKNLLDAVNAVRQGALSYRRAFKTYGVPVMTIQNRVSGKIYNSASPDRPITLPHEAELQIIGKLKQAAETVGKCKKVFKNRCLNARLP